MHFSKLVITNRLSISCLLEVWSTTSTRYFFGCIILIDTRRKKIRAFRAVIFLSNVPQRSSSSHISWRKRGRFKMKCAWRWSLFCDDHLFFTFQALPMNGVKVEDFWPLFDKKRGESRKSGREGYIMKWNVPSAEWSPGKASFASPVTCHLCTHTKFCCSYIITKMYSVSQKILTESCWKHRAPTKSAMVGTPT